MGMGFGLGRDESRPKNPNSAMSESHNNAEEGADECFLFRVAMPLNV
jgi:hypothetical protein